VLHNQVSYPLAHALTGTHWLRLRPPPQQSLYWNLSEQGWAKAAWSFFSAWNCGAALFIHDDRSPFSAKRTLQILHTYPITTLCAPPTVWRQLVLDENRALIASGELRPKALKHATGAGEPLNESVIRRWAGIEGMNGMLICDGYGQTESILVCANQEGVPIRYGSMGKPLPNVPLTVIDNDGIDAGVDVEGDIAIRVPATQSDPNHFMGLFEGYINMSTGALSRNLRTFPDGAQFYLTGDRARRDSAGYFWFVGRSDDVINSAGYRIGPFEVESTLKLHDIVVESAVVASPDPQRDEVVKAFVVLTDAAAMKVKEGGEEAERGLVKELQAFCKENAAPYKYPRKIEFVDAQFLPKTISGKIRRGELKKLERERYGKESKKAKL
jgi:medium-chain acyl-CoA synthetase